MRPGRGARGLLALGALIVAGTAVVVAVTLAVIPSQVAAGSHGAGGGSTATPSDRSRAAPPDAFVAAVIIPGEPTFRDPQGCAMENGPLNDRLLCEHDLGSTWTYDMGVDGRATVICLAQYGVFVLNLVEFPRFLNNGVLDVDEWVHQWPSSVGATAAMQQLRSDAQPCKQPGQQGWAKRPWPVGVIAGASDLGSWTLTWHGATSVVVAVRIGQAVVMQIGVTRLGLDVTPPTAADVQRITQAAVHRWLTGSAPAH